MPESNKLCERLLKGLGFSKNQWLLFFSKTSKLVLGLEQGSDITSFPLEIL